MPCVSFGFSSFSTLSTICHSFATNRESFAPQRTFSLGEEYNFSTRPGTRTSSTVKLVDVELLGRNRMYSAVRCQVGREQKTSEKEAKLAIRRRRALKRVDKELSRGNFKNALTLVKQHQRNPTGCLRGFGAAKQVPKRLSSLNELELDAKELLTLQSLFSSVMETIESSNLFDSFDEAPSDTVESLIEYERYVSLSEEDYFMCLQHEAGHFLVSYLLGVLPKGYEVPSIEALRQGKVTTGRTDHFGFEFLNKLAIARMLSKDIGQVGSRTIRGTISYKTLNNFSCVILGGLVAEHIVSGRSEGHFSDMDKLENLLRWLGYKRSEAESHVRWAALNTVLISHRHAEVRSRLAAVMALRRSVGFCIDTIEDALYGKEI